MESLGAAWSSDNDLPIKATVALSIGVPSALDRRTIRTADAVPLERDSGDNLKVTLFATTS
jgi:hypothetical protein